MKKIGLLGCGAIGTQIALAIDSGEISASLTHVYDESKDSAINLVSKLNTKPEIVENSHLLSSYPVNIVVEAASQDAVKDVALSVLQNKRDLMIMSVGALRRPGRGPSIVRGGRASTRTRPGATR